MKKLFFSLVILFSFFVFPTQTFAQEDQEVVVEEVQEEANELNEEAPKVATPPATVKYDLAYPGTLPDSPFYKLKVLRDRIILSMISYPQKKMEYYLLQTDKGILASAILVDKGKTQLAVETALKAENNYTLIAHEIKSAKKADKEFVKKLETAALKHQEVLESLSKRVKGEEKKTFETVKDFSKRNLETIKKYGK